MKKYLNIILIALGSAIASTLIHFTSISALDIIIASLVIVVSALLISFIAHNQANTTSNSKSKKPAKKPKIKASKNPNKTVDGTVKWFNKTKGFGFITQSNGDDVFVHQTSIASKPNILREGQSVTMSVVNDEKGPQAENVKVA